MHRRSEPPGMRMARSQEDFRSDSDGPRSRLSRRTHWPCENAQNRNEHFLRYNYQFRKFQTARSLLDQSRFLRPNTHFSAFFETYKICKPLHRSKFKICRFFAFFSWFFEIFSKFCWNFQKSVIFVEIFTDFCRNFKKCSTTFGNPENLQNFAKFHAILMKFCKFRHENLVVAATTKICSWSTT